MPITPNIFARLHKWAARQDENFLTEALSLILEHILLLAPGVGTRLVSRLTCGFIDLPADDAGSIEINPQVITGQGRPDLEIRVPDRLVWIEVKAESVLRAGQLEGYRVLLSQSGVVSTRLGLLTRYPEEFARDAERPDHQIRWFEVADWLENELPVLETVGEVAVDLPRQFLTFLRTRGMTLTQVGKYMPEGLRALNNLLNMLSEAAQACKISSVKKSANWEKIGLKFDHGGKYWIGVYLDDPEKLWFASKNRIRLDAAARLEVGETVTGEYSWRRRVQLDSEDIHFFSRTKVSQMEWLQEFLRDSLAKAKSIETPDQPPISEEPEDD